MQCLISGIVGVLITLTAQNIIPMIVAAIHAVG